MALIALLAGAALLARAGQAPDRTAGGGGDLTARAVVRASFDVSGPVDLEFDGLAGSLSVQPGAPGKLEVTAFKVGRGASQDEALARAAATALSIRREGDRVVCSARAGGLFPWSPRAPLPVDYQVVAPEESGLRVIDATGSVVASGLHRTIDITGGNLVVRLTNVGGAAVTTRQGSIAVDGAAGPVRLQAGGGDIQAQRVAGPELTLDAAGSLYLAEAEVAGRLAATAGGGPATLLRTRGGRIEVVARSGAIALTDVSADGEIRLEGDARGVTVTRAQAHPLGVATGRGGVELDEVQGDVAVRTGGGGVALYGASPTSLAVSSAGGDVYFAGGLPAKGPTSVDTGGGKLQLTIARESAFDLDADAGRGSLAVAEALLPGHGAAASRASAPVNGGGPEVTLRTHGGQLTVSTR